MSSGRQVVGIEWLRAFAAVAVVEIHAAAGASPSTAPLVALCQFAVPAFALLAGYLAADSMRRHPLDGSTYASHRLRRLLPAYLFWTVVYLGLRWVLHTLQHKAMGLEGLWGALRMVLLGGAGPHLWFLPVLFYAQMLAYPVLRIAGREGHGTRAATGIAVALAGACLALCLALPAGLTSATLLGYAKLYALRLLGFLLLGCVACWHGERWLMAWRWKMSRWLLGAAGLAAAARLAVGSGGVGSAGVLAVCLFLAAIALPDIPMPLAISRLAAASMGIYLAHVLFTTVLSQAWLRLAHAPVGTAGSLLTVFLAVVASLLVVRVMGRLSFLRPFIV